MKLQSLSCSRRILFGPEIRKRGLVLDFGCLLVHRNVDDHLFLAACGRPLLSNEYYETEKSFDYNQGLWLAMRRHSRISFALALCEIMQSVDIYQRSAAFRSPERQRLLRHPLRTPPALGNAKGHRHKVFSEWLLIPTCSSCVSLLMRR